MPDVLPDFDPTLPELLFQWTPSFSAVPLSTDPVMGMLLFF